MLEIKYHPNAIAEAFRSAEYYDRQQKGLGKEFFDELDGAIHSILDDPLRAKVEFNCIRSRRLRRFPFRIYYIVDPQRIRVLAVAHLKRRPRYWGERTSE